MSRIKILLGAALTLICSGALAQQNLFPAQNIKSAIAATESIKESIQKYQALTEEANDTSWMRS